MRSPNCPQPSSYSSNGGACIEVAANLAATHGTVPVRDSKAPTGPTLTFATSTWSSFVNAVKAAESPTAEA